MLLAVDIGNSQTSFGVFDGEKLIRHWRSETRAVRTSDEFAALLLPLFQHARIDPGKFSGVALCSVVPAADTALERFCQDYLRLVPLTIDAERDLGTSLQVDFPREVGADRLANAAYAARHLRLPAIVVDFGTATTFDLITEHGYQGGAIVPGARLSVSALSGGTAKLVSVDLAFPDSVIGRNTTDCIRSGVLYGYCDLIDGLLERMAKETGRSCEVVLTGGLASLFQGRLKTKTRLCPDLTLEGIALIYHRHATGRSA